MYLSKDIGKLVCFHGNDKKLGFYEVYSTWGISFLVSNVETQK